jgi:hypothetical protein
MGRQGIEARLGRKHVEWRDSEIKLSRSGRPRNRRRSVARSSRLRDRSGKTRSSVSRSSSHGGAVSLEKSEAHAAITSSSRRGWQRTTCSGVTRSRKHGEAVRMQRRDSEIKLSQRGRSRKKEEHVMRSPVHRGVTRSASYGCAAELGIGAAGWCGDQAMTGLLVWNQVRQRDAVIELRRRAWSGTKCGSVMQLSSCGCAGGVERSAAAVEMELG